MEVVMSYLQKGFSKIATNATKKFHSEKVKHKIDFYIFHTVLLGIILLLIITIICYYCVKYRSK